jgi:hypothetical protein
MSTLPIPVMITPVRNIVGGGTAGSGSSGQIGANGAIEVTSNLQETVIVADAVVEEEGDDEMVITDHPIEVGATVSDHAFKLPSKLGLIYAWALGSTQNSNTDPGTGEVTKDPDFLKNIYQQMLTLQASATLCVVNTGKRIYQNMLIRTLSMRTDKETENSLTLRVEMKEIILVTTQLVNQTPASQQAFPQKTAPTINQGAVSLQPGTNFNPAELP